VHDRELNEHRVDGIDAGEVRPSSAIAQTQQRRLPRARWAGDDRQPGVGQLRVEAVQSPRILGADADLLEANNGGSATA
jgi:hypothetical protein